MQLEGRKKNRVIFVTRSHHRSLVTVAERDSEPVLVGSSNSVPPNDDHYHKFLLTKVSECNGVRFKRNRAANAEA